MKIVANYLNLAFHVKVKTKSNHNFLNFVFHFIENTKCHFGYMDSQRIQVSFDAKDL